MLHLDLDSLIGEAYYCEALTSSSLGFGTLTANDIAVAKAIYGGLHNSAGNRAYLSWQIGSDLSDGDPTYNNEAEAWELNIPSTGGMYVRKYIRLLDLDNLDNLDGVTYDTLTTNPDISAFRDSGAKLLHYHGESDPSILSASSVHYWQSVRNIMYPHVPDHEAHAAMAGWYQFYLVRGAAHCGTNSLQPGPYPSENMAVIIDWVENRVRPTGLNSTVSSGDYEGEGQMLYQFPMRPRWKSDSAFDCVADPASMATWTYDFTAFKVAVY